MFVMMLGACVFGACGAVKPTEKEVHGVGGNVHGLWNGSDGIGLQLEAGGIRTPLVVSTDGVFSFGSKVGSGTSYTVTILKSPAGHSCLLDAGSTGAVTDADVTNVSVACTGPATSIELSGSWKGTFDPTLNTQTFSGSIIMQDVALTVGGGSLTSAGLPGISLTLGQPSAPIDLPLGSTTLAVTVASAALSKTYQLVFDRGGSTINQLVYGKASNTGTGDGFGNSVALSGDTLAVGAPFESSKALGINGNQADDGASHAGAVYVFVHTGTTWTQQAYLKASNTDAADSFGSSIALMDDTLVVGAPFEASAAKGVNGSQTDNTAFGAGAVYVFVRSGTTWTQQAYLKASNAERLDVFGASVALSGNTLAVGAPGESSSATGVNGDQASNAAETSGAAYVFARAGTVWTQQAYIKASNTGVGDDFGLSVTLSGDTLAVGAPNEDSAAAGINGSQNNEGTPEAGAVYVFTRTGAAWMQQAYIKASNTATSDLFGTTVALSRDTLAVGAFGEDSNATGVNGNQTNDGARESGAVYVFVRGGAIWTQQAYLKASNTGSGQNFGLSLCLVGDTLATGAPGESSAATGVGGNQGDNTAPGAGAAYVFVRTGTTWMPHAYVKASNSGNEDAFGGAIALGRDTLMVSASNEASAAVGINPASGQADNASSGAGAVYVFR